MACKRILTIAALLLTGCKSLSDKISDSIATEDLTATRLILEKDGVLEKPKDKWSSSEQEAVKIFTDAVDETHLQEVKNRLDQGLARGASESLDTGLSLAPWSSTLQSKAAEVNETLIGLSDLRSRLASYFGAGNQLENLYEISNQFEGVAKFRRDSPAICEALKRLTCRAASSLDIDPIDYQRYVSSIRKLGDEEEANTLLGILSLIKKLETDEYELSPQAERSKWAQLNRYRNGQTDSPESTISCAINPLISYLQQSLLFNLESKLEEQLHTALSEASERLIIFEELFDSKMLQSLAKGHIRAAKQNAAGGSAAAASIAHLIKANEVADKLEQPLDFEGIRNTALSSIFDAGVRTIDVHIDLPLELTREELILATIGIYAELNKNKSPYIDFAISPASRKNESDLVISVDTWKIYAGDTTTRQVSSSYLSHNENVANPRKSSLKRQLESQEISVDFAESSYERAVSWFNINPTEWGLASVNTAKNSYLNAVNRYNSLVSQYNTTPSTISRPVYLPYTFTAGTVKLGIEFRGRMTWTNQKGHLSEQAFSVSSIKSDEFRLGTKVADRNRNYRRDNFIDIDLTSESLLELSNNAHRSFAGQISRFINNYERPFADSLIIHPEDRKLANYLLRPWPELASAQAFSSWSQSTLRAAESEIKQAVTLRPRSVSKVHIDTMTASRLSRDNLENADQLKSIVQIKNPLGVGTGFLISQSGFVLTCAHTLQAANNQVRFIRGSDQDWIDAEVISIDRSLDVALIKIDSPPSGSVPAQLSLDLPPKAGEEVVCISCPNVSDTVIQGATTFGSVSKPCDHMKVPEETTYHYFDLTVASGSSGGPIFDCNSGKVIGIVVQVVVPGIENNYASSGAWAAAVPVHLLDEYGYITTDQSE